MISVMYSVFNTILDITCHKTWCVRFLHEALGSHLSAMHANIRSLCENMNLSPSALHVLSCCCHYDWFISLLIVSFVIWSEVIDVLHHFVFQGSNVVEDQDLLEIGILNSAHRQRLLQAIRLLPRVSAPVRDLTEAIIPPTAHWIPKTFNRTHTMHHYE